MHEPFYFLAGDDHIPSELTDEPADTVTERGWNRNDRPGLSDNRAYLPDQLTIGKGLRADGVDYGIRSFAALLTASAARSST